MQKQYSILKERREVWKSKTILKILYQRWCRMIGSALKPGSILEIGGGSGNLKEFFKELISSDVVFVPWIDAVLDAHHLPFRDATFDNIILFDVLHHLHDPVQFFSQAQNVLKHKGRILLMEPYVSWVSFFIYRFLHPENLVLNKNPLNKRRLNIDQKRNFSNQAIPSLIFQQYNKQFVDQFPHLNIIKKEKTDFIIYPLSGGFHHPNLCPIILFTVFDYMEKLLRPLNRLLAFRLFVVLEKT
jgi:SAM-dependent methyltransferase